MAITMNPYLTFNGNAADALAHYERVFGAKAEQVSRAGDMPGGKVPDEQKHLIIHARIPVGGTMLMMSDDQPGNPPQRAGNVTVCLQLDDLDEAHAKFNALAEGGVVQVPLQVMFWGATFGLLKDAYGIPWMFNCEAKKA